VEVPVLLLLDLLFDAGEALLLAVEHRRYAEAGIAGALAVGFQFAELEQVVDHVLSLAR